MRTIAEMAAEAGMDCGGGRWIVRAETLAVFTALVRADSHRAQEHAADVRATFAALTARNDRPDLKAAIDFAIGVANELQKRRESL